MLIGYFDNFHLNKESNIFYKERQEKRLCTKNMWGEKFFQFHWRGK